MKKTVLLTFPLILIFALCIKISAQQPADITLDAAMRGQVINSLFKDMNASYVFPEVAKNMEMDVRNRQKNGEYDGLTSATAFAQKLTDDLRGVSKDKHIRVRFSSRVIPARATRSEPSAAEIEEQKMMMRVNNYGFVKVENLRGNVGYVDLRGFSDPEFGAETVAAAMNFVNNSDALIFDLRQNGGGDPAMVALICSYLFGDKPIHLNDLYWRAGNKTEEFWTKPEKAAKKYTDKPIYVLTSNRTFSGAEEFSYNLKNLKRATIVGETTGGGANPGGGFRLTDHFEAFIPTGRAISPITKTNWEGTGVEPDIKVPQDQALKTAYLMALNKFMETAKDERLVNALKQLIDQTQKELGEMKAKA